MRFIRILYRPGSRKITCGNVRKLLSISLGSPSALRLLLSSYNERGESHNLPFERNAEDDENVSGLSSSTADTYAQIRLSCSPARISSFVLTSRIRMRAVMGGYNFTFG